MFKVSKFADSSFTEVNIEKASKVMITIPFLQQQ